MSITLISKRISLLKPLIEREGIVVLPRSQYDRILKKIEEQEQQMKRIREETYIDAIIAQGEQEFAEGKTIVATSSKDAIKIFHDKKKH